MLVSRTKSSRDVLQPHSQPQAVLQNQLKQLENYRDLEIMHIFGSDQLERDNLKDFVAWGAGKTYSEVQRISLWDSNYSAVTDINLKLQGFKIFHYSFCTPFAMISFQSDGFKFTQVMLE